MVEILNKYLPNVMSKIPEFQQSIIDTLIMVLWSGIIA